MVNISVEKFNINESWIFELNLGCSRGFCKFSVTRKFHLSYLMNKFTALIFLMKSTCVRTNFTIGAGLAYKMRLSLSAKHLTSYLLIYFPIKDRKLAICLFIM